MKRSNAALVFQALLFTAVHGALRDMAITSLCDGVVAPIKETKHAGRYVGWAPARIMSPLCSVSLSFSAADLQLELTHFSSCFPLKTQTWIFHLKKQNRTAH